MSIKAGNRETDFRTASFSGIVHKLTKRQEQLAEFRKDMNENETVIYEQSRVLAWAQRYLDGYDNYIAMNMKEEALDMLLMAMRNREDLLNEAAKYSVEIEVNSVYDSIESLLAESYGLSEADVEEINSIKKDRDYTIRLMEIVGTFES